MKSTEDVVRAWRKEGGDKASLFTLFLAIGAGFVIGQIPRLVTITLLFVGKYALATAFLLTSTIVVLMLTAWRAYKFKRHVDVAFDGKETK